MESLADGFVYYVVFLLSTTVHEASHAWAAKIGGDLTAYQGGQVSLDPRPHMQREPFGMVILPVITVLISGWPFGFASAPYDPDWARQYPRRAAWMALAGPGSNLALVVISGILINIGLLIGVFYAPDNIQFGHITAASNEGVFEGIAFILGVIFSLNLVLFILNMFPLPPLDGSGALPLILPESVVTRYQEFLWSQPMIGWIGILIAWQLFAQVFWPVFFSAVNIMYPGVSYG